MISTDINANTGVCGKMSESTLNQLQKLQVGKMHCCALTENFFLLLFSIFDSVVKKLDFIIYYQT